MNMYTNIKTLANLYYQRMLAEHSGEQISEGDLTSLAQYICTTACHSTVTLLQTGTSTSILTLHRHFLSVRYLSGLSLVSMSGNWSGMAICLPHEEASRVACRRACILIGLIFSTIGRCRLIKKFQKSFGIFKRSIKIRSIGRPLESIRCEYFFRVEIDIQINIFRFFSYGHLKIINEFGRTIIVL